MLNQLGYRLGVIRIQTDPDAGADKNFLSAGQRKRLLKTLYKSQCDFHRSLRIIHLFQNHQKLITSEASQTIFLTQPAAEALGNYGKQFIANRMSETIVDRLEMIQIDK